MTDNDADAEKNVTFESLGLHPQLCKQCAELGYKNPTAIQAKSIPWALQGEVLPLEDVAYNSRHESSKCGVQ